MHMQQRTIQTGQRAGTQLIGSNKNMSNMDWRLQHKEQDTKVIHREVCLFHGHINISLVICPLIMWKHSTLIKNMHSL